MKEKRQLDLTARGLADDLVGDTATSNKVDSDGNAMDLSFAMPQPKAVAVPPVGPDLRGGRFVKPRGTSGSTSRASSVASSDSEMVSGQEDQGATTTDAGSEQSWRQVQYRGSAGKPPVRR